MSKRDVHRFSGICPNTEIFGQACNIGFNNKSTPGGSFNVLTIYTRRVNTNDK